MSRKMQGVELSLPVELSFLVLVGFPSGHLHLPSSVIPVLSLSSRSFTVIPVLSLSSPRKRGSMAPHPLSKRARQAVPLRDIRDLAGGVSGQWLSSRAPILPPLRHPRESGDPWSLTRFPKGHVKPCPYGTYETSLVVFPVNGCHAVPLRDIRDLAGGVSGQWLSCRAPILPPLRHPRGSGDPWSAPHFLDSRFRGNDGLGVGNDGLGVGNDGLGVGNDGLGGWE
ncbi:MAG: hypothetical protein DIKNOCCD_00434 [bacterium]|nr:hypothetical protein [bacterium]